MSWFLKILFTKEDRIFNLLIKISTLLYVPLCKFIKNEMISVTKKAPFFFTLAIFGQWGKLIFNISRKLFYAEPALPIVDINARIKVKTYAYHTEHSLICSWCKGEREDLKHNHRWKLVTILLDCFPPSHSPHPT